MRDTETLFYPSPVPRSSNLDLIVCFLLRNHAHKGPLLHPRFYVQDAFVNGFILVGVANGFYSQPLAHCSDTAHGHQSNGRGLHF